MQCLAEEIRVSSMDSGRKARVLLTNSGGKRDFRHRILKKHDLRQRIAKNVFFFLKRFQIKRKFRQKVADKLMIILPLCCIFFRKFAVNYDYYFFFT